MALELQPGDEVITTDFTFAATVEVIALLNLKPILIDVDLETFNIDCDKLVKAIGPKTKAIVPVHLFGQPADMEKIMQISKENNLYVIEDNAQAIGAKYQFKSGLKKKVGTIGDIGTTSFFPSKNLGCFGDGGALFTNNDELAIKIRGIVNHGMYKRYHHDVVGVNSRLDSVQAAILNAKLPYLNLYNKSRQESARKYSEALKNCNQIITPILSNGCTEICGSCDCHVFHQYTILANNRSKIIEALNSKGIQTSIFYKYPVHKQKVFYSKYKTKVLKNCEYVQKRCLSLPIYPELNEKDIYKICSIIKKVK